MKKKQLPEDFPERYRAIFGKEPTANMITHCRHELMHAVWRLLLDDRFVRAHRYGIIIRCADGVRRRIFPRIFHYAADYPEK